MKSGGGKRKGSQFERDISRELSRWFSDGERADVFWLTSGSGARHTTRMKSSKATANSAGDLGYLDEFGKPFIDMFLIEIKRGYTNKIDPLAFLDGTGKKNLIIDWITKANKEAYESGRGLFMLIFKRDYHKKCVVIDYDTFIDLEPYCGVFDRDLLRMNSGESSVAIVLYDDFFEWLSRESVVQYMEDTA